MSDDGLDPFYLVWNPARTVPGHKHEAESLAITEAERLARTNPGQTFYVMKSITGRTVAEPMQTIKFKFDDIIPF